MDNFECTFNVFLYTIQFTENPYSAGRCMSVDTNISFLLDEDMFQVCKLEIEEIPGVLKVEVITKYELKIEKGLCFTWHEIVDPTVDILKKYIANPSFYASSPYAGALSTIDFSPKLVKREDEIYDY